MRVNLRHTTHSLLLKHIIVYWIGWTFVQPMENKSQVNHGLCEIYGKPLKSNKVSIGLAAYPKQLKPSGIKSLMERAIKAQEVEKILKQGNNHNTREWKGMHGYRKAFNSILVKSGVNYAVKEKLMGHDMKLDNNYLKLTEDEMLNEYLKADLIFNEEFRLKKKVDELQVKYDRIDKLVARIEDLEKQLAR